MIPDLDQDHAETGPEPGRWEQRAGETPRSYGAFSVYRGLGALRSLRRAAAAFYSDSIDQSVVTQAQLNQLKTWSAANDWPARAQAWDDYVDAASRVEHVEAIKEMNRLHATIGRGFVEVASAALARLDSDPGAKLTPTDMARLIDVGVKVERLARGEVTDIIERSRERDADFGRKRAHALAALDEIEAYRKRHAAVQQTDVSCIPTDGPT
jgi:hypothetical protein